MRDFNFDKELYYINFEGLLTTHLITNNKWQVRNN